MKTLNKLTLIAIVWSLPLFLGQMDTSLYFGETASAQEKKKTRKVPAMRERTYKKLAEAQLMIDPESIPREEGEPPPEPTGTPQDAIALLTKLRGSKGLNSYELAQIWNTLAFAYYTLEDLPNTIRSYEQILKQGTITEALEMSALRALFQLYYAEEDYRRAIQYIDRWQAMQVKPDPNITFIKSTAYYQLENFRDNFQ